MPSMQSAATHRPPLKTTFDRLLTPVEEFTRRESASGILLIAATLIALVWANSPWEQGYAHFVHLPVGVGAGAWRLEFGLQHWVNDGLMALFFFVVGMEIKRELLSGELSEFKQAVLPIAAAVGGMLVPAAIYAGLNWDSEGLRGWGIPMATDIAFAVGVLSFLKGRVPAGLVTFLLALAIVDDLGAVLVIALFYTQEIQAAALVAAAGLWGALWLLNLGGVRGPHAYWLFGVLLWFAVLQSGVHATVAGVLAALAVPARARLDPLAFSARARALIARFEGAGRAEPDVRRNAEARELLEGLEHGVRQAQTPLNRFEDALHMPVSFLIIPLFALVNAGIPLSGEALGAAVADPVALGVFAGLVLGKPLGVAGFAWLALKLGVAHPPAGVGSRHLIGAGLLAGIGFTMSIFIAGLSFADPALLVVAKSGILLASLAASLLGLGWLYAAGGRMAPSRTHHLDRRGS